jgi:CubicO group peptidase (beta-lactamase class C family)
MQLVEQGKLDLDQDVSTYLDFSIPQTFPGKLTLRHLLTHTGGFDQVIKAIGYLDPQLIVPLADYVRRYRPPRVYPQGTTPAYSNYGMVLAGYIVQRISGEPFEDYVERHIFGPLGMTRSTFRQPPPAPLAADLSHGYVAAGESPFEILGTMPAGGMTSTAVDMAKFMSAHLADGRFRGSEILRPETARLMHRAAWPEPPGFNGMALGFKGMSRPGQRSIGHGGDTNAFHSGLMLYLDAGVGIYVSVNSQGSGNLDGNTVVGMLIDGFGERFVPADPIQLGPPLPTAREHAALAAGRYLSSRHFDRSFLSLLTLRQDRVEARSDGTITLSSATRVDGSPKIWREVEPFVWQDIDGRDRLLAMVEDGRVTRIQSSAEASTVLLRAEGSRRAPWNTALIAFAVVVLGLHALIQLVGFVRRLIRRPASNSGTIGWSGRAVAACALVGSAVILGWVVVFRSLLNGDPALPSGTADPMLRTVQVLGWIFVALSPIALAGTIAVVHSDRRLRTKLGSIVVMAASAALVWLAFAFHLLGPSLLY